MGFGVRVRSCRVGTAPHEHAASLLVWPWTHRLPGTLLQPSCVGLPAVSRVPDPLACSPQGGRGRFSSEKCGITESSPGGLPGTPRMAGRSPWVSVNLPHSVPAFPCEAEAESWGQRLSVALIMARESGASPPHLTCLVHTHPGEVSPALPPACCSSKVWGRACTSVRPSRDSG